MGLASVPRPVDVELMNAKGSGVFFMPRHSTLID